MYLTPTPVANKSSTSAFKRTIQRRNVFIKDQLQSTSKDLVAQAGFFMKSLGLQERQLLINEAGIKPSHIEASEMVAMKSNLGLSWERMKTLVR